MQHFEKFHVPEIKIKGGARNQDQGCSLQPMVKKVIYKRQIAKE
jgi:hypothetical protein